MDIKRAKQEIKDSIEAYLAKDEFGDYRIPAIRQRPIFLVGPPGIGKTQIMEQIAKECRIGLVAYTITHHTRQSAVGLPFIQEKEYGGKTVSVTEYTMSEIIASVLTFHVPDDRCRLHKILFRRDILQTPNICQHTQPSRDSTARLPLPVLPVSIQLYESLYFHLWMESKIHLSSFSLPVI